MIPDACCGDIPFNSGEKGCCTDENSIFFQTFDRSKQDCCNGNAFNTQNGVRKCCGRQTYDSRTQECCNSDDSMVTPIGGCNFSLCDNLTFNAQTHSCCGDVTIYDHAVLECCDTNIGLTSTKGLCPRNQPVSILTTTEIISIPNATERFDPISDLTTDRNRNGLFLLADDVFEDPFSFDSADPSSCAWTKWTDWSDCSGGYAGAYQIRKREFLTRSGNSTDCLVQELADAVSGVTDGFFWHDAYEQRRTFDEITGQSCVLNEVLTMGNSFLKSRKTRDLIIITDESTSITSDNFDLVKAVLGSLVEVLCGGIGPDANRVAVLRFSSETKEDIDFIQGSNRKGLLKSIRKLKYKPIRNTKYHGSTYTAKALNYVQENILKPDKGWRENTENVKTEVLIITDGRSNDPDAFGFTLEAEKEKLKAQGIDVFALGIGNVYESEINLMTSDNPDHIFYFPTWRDFGTFGSILERVKVLQDGSTTGIDGDGDEICLPIELSEEDKEELGVTGRRKRKKRGLKRLNRMPKNGLSKSLNAFGSEDILDEVSRFFGSILS